jgi:glycerol-3-phosphate acyltransferase PlsY
MLESVSFILFSYLCGSIPFGLIITRAFVKKDIRKIGSGNIGATNVLRVGNKYLAIITLILDIFKGYIPVIIAIEYFSSTIYLAALFAMLGHIFPVWLKFKGGKGVATYLGIISALSVQLGFLFIFSWIIVSLIFKYSSLSSMFASLTVFVVNFMRETVILNDPLLKTTITVPDSQILFIFFILIIFTHRKNIQNLRNKKENKIKI